MIRSMYAPLPPPPPPPDRHNIKHQAVARVGNQTRRGLVAEPYIISAKRTISESFDGIVDRQFYLYFNVNYDTNES